MIETRLAAVRARLNGLSGSISRDLPRKIEWIKKELASIQCLLQDAASKSENGDEDAKQWVKAVNEACYQIEDVADDVEQVEEARRRREGNFFKQCVDLPGEMIVIHEIVSHADNIIFAMREISDAGKQRYAASTSLNEDEVNRYQQETSNDSFAKSCLNDETTKEVAGFESEFKHVVSLLTDPEKIDRTVILLVGVDGLGKTTLAKKVYDSEEIRENFQIAAWVVAPPPREGKSSTTIDLLNNLLKELLGLGFGQKSYNNTTEITTNNLEKMQEKETIEKIRELLKPRKYLIVLDDISYLNTEIWSEIQQVFPNSENGNRILVTTPNLEMVKPEEEEEPFPFLHTVELQLLSDEESWEFLKSNIFHSSSDDNNLSFIDELEPLGRTLANSCRGFPLALVLLSGLLSRNLNYNSWSDIADKIERESMQCEEKLCQKVLFLHQNNLPNTYVKSCFHYIASFPKNSLISTSKLFKLWIAEGLIPHNPKCTFEQTAHEYLVVLIERHLVQVAQKNGSTGRVKKIRIHGILHRWCIEQAQKNGFFDIVENNSTEMEGNCYSNSNCVFVKDNNILLIDNTFVESLYNPRSIVASSIELHELKQQACNKLHSLRVFDLENSHFKNWNKLEEAFLKMRHLRHLGLRKANIWGNASFTRNLTQLQTFDARGPFITNIVPEFWNIRTLRNVYLTGNIVPTVTSHVVQSLYKLHLDLHIPSTYNWKPLIQLLEKQNELIFLTIKIKGHGAIPVAIFTLFNNRGKLHFLKLDGKLNPPQLPEITELPSTLIELTLIRTHLKKDPMPVLELLPNLILLRLEYGSYKGSAGMFCSANGFPKLQELKIDGSCKVQGWNAEAGAMSSLVNLHIMAYDFMEKLPEALTHLRSLKELHVTVYEEDSDWLATRMNSKDGEDWCKIQHVPYIGVHLLPNLYFTEKPITSLKFVGRDELVITGSVDKVESPPNTYNDKENQITKLYLETYNFTMMQLWTRYFVRYETMKVNGSNTETNVYLDEMDPNWVNHVREANYVVISGGHWFFRNLNLYQQNKLIGTVYEQSQKKNNISIPTLGLIFAVQNAFRTALIYLSSSNTGNVQLVVVRTFSPTHFEGGVWNSGGSCTRTMPNLDPSPLKGNHMEMRNMVFEEMERIRKQRSRCHVCSDGCDVDDEHEARCASQGRLRQPVEPWFERLHSLVHSRTH